MDYLLPQKLNKYYIITKKENTDLLVKRLQDAGVFHINYADSSLGIPNFKTDLSEDVKRKNVLDIFLDLVEQEGLVAASGNKKVDSKVLKKMADVVKHLTALRTDLKAIETDSEVALALEALKINDLSVFDYKIKLNVFYSTKNETIDFVRSAKVNNLIYYVLTEEQKPSPSMKKIELDVITRLNSNLETVKRTLLDKEKAAKNEIKDHVAAAKRICKEYGASIAEQHSVLSDSIVRKAAIEKMAYEDRFAVISCFAPVSFDIETLSDHNTKIIKMPFLPEEAPTVRNRKPLINDFSFLTWLYGTPSYTEADPSLIVTVTFPLMFGAIVGDVGYGLVLLFGAVLLAFLNTAFKKYLFWLVILSALSSIVFGLLFGEFFGNLISIPALLFYRLENIQALLFGSAIGGSLMVMLGTLLNTTDAMLNRDKKRTIGSVGWLSLAILSVIEVFSLYLFSTINQYALMLLPFGFVLIGLGNLIDLSGALNVFVNVISFLRIAAVGLSSVMLAMLINDLGRYLLGYSIILALITMGFLHLLNIIFDALVAFLQSLRLEYVEFFSKFFRGSGKDYEPLRHVSEEDNA